MRIFVCRFVFSGDEERTAKKNQKTPKPYQVGLSSPRGTPKGKKRGLLREDISPPYSALEETETTKSASEEEKTDPVYIIYLTGNKLETGIKSRNTTFPGAVKKDTTKYLIFWDSKGVS